MKLINLSNHPSDKWSEEQKKMWEDIIDIPFPNIEPESSAEEVENIARKYVYKIGEAIIKHNFSVRHNYIMLQGEYSFCYTLAFLLRDSISDFTFAIPTTERTVVEKDGVKSSVFKFVKWRFV